MISFLIGVIEEKRESILELNVNGVGFEVNASSNTLGALPMPGSNIKIYTYLAVREDDVSLYGFSSVEERELFFKLISVSGIGRRMALSILSGLSISDLTMAIINCDTRLLSKIKGLGKKTAERVCLELKDKLSILSMPETNLFKNEYDEDALQMAVDTLISLGINKNDAYVLARSYATKDTTAEEIISKSLRGYKG